MRKQAIRQHHEPLKLAANLTDLARYEIHSPLISEYLCIAYQVEVFYQTKDDTMIVHGAIDYCLNAIDARDGAMIEHAQILSWDDEYSLNEFTPEDINVIAGEEVDFGFLAVEQINANIPINLSHNHGIISKTGLGWSLMSEDEYEQQQSNQPDSRWDKLKEFKLASKIDDKK